MEDKSSLNSEIETIADVYNGRIVVVNQDFKIVQDTFHIAESRLHIAETVIRSFQGETVSRYNRDKHYFAQAMPIYSLSPDKHVEGVLVMTASTEAMARLTESVGDRLVLFQVILVLVLVLAAVLAAAMMVRPFKEFQAKLHHVEQGALDTDISSEAYRETRDISNSVAQTITKLQEADQSRQEFVSNVSHELKTPITSIRVLADSLMGMGEVPVELYREFMEDISNEIDRESKIIDENPTIYLKKNVGGIPQKDRLPLTDEQVDKLLDAIYGLPPYVFVMLGLYAGLRREEILGLQWDSVYLDCEAPYLTVRRAWHTEHNRPVILTELKTKAAHRNVPLPDNLLECLKEAKKTSTSDYVVANRDGDPLSYTQFKRLWQYIVTPTTKERCYYRYEDGKRVKHTVKPVLGQKAAHNGNVVYSLDFEVTPHQLRHTYITNLIHASVDPKTVQYLAGHESSKITMDIYAKVKYNRPEQLAGVLEDAFASWD